MRFAQLMSLALAATLVVLPAAAHAQDGVQPYNPQDPQNYGAPAAQSYYAGQQAQPQYQPPQYQQQPQYQQPPQYQGQPQPYDNGAGNGYGYPPDQGQYGSPGGQEQIYQAPPPIPAYDQPSAPGDGYIWTPGYWAYGPAGYYWVPGAWVEAPYDGALWTPGYWGDGPSGYFWNAGYWGPVVGFYGGINYGFGYFGTGFYGGYWRDHRFFYNSLYSHVGYGVRNVYSQRYAGISSVRPGGRSFSTVSAPRGMEARGGSYNGSQFAGASRGYAPGQAALGHPAYAGSSYSAMNRGTYAAPVQRSYAGQAYAGQSYSAARTQQGYSGGGSRAAAPAAHFSAPSGGGGHASGGGHAGGGHR